MKTDVASLEKIAKEIRLKTYGMVEKAGGGHIAPALSIVEILTILYFNIMNYDPQNPTWEERDRFILSKGHACASLYPVLAKVGFFPEDVLDTFCQPGSFLGGHPRMEEIPGVEATTGALGHGFLFAAGIALAGKLDKKNYRVFTILGDGECQEGAIWEGALFASHYKLGNFTAIVDYNKLQAMDFTDNIINMEPFADKWKAFGWDIYEVDGHDFRSLNGVLNNTLSLDAKPRLIVAHTVKGKGVSFMENQPLWHYRMPNQQELVILKNELEL